MVKPGAGQSESPWTDVARCSSPTTWATRSGECRPQRRPNSLAERVVPRRLRWLFGRCGHGVAVVTGGRSGAYVPEVTPAGPSNRSPSEHRDDAAAERARIERLRAGDEREL